MTKVVLALLAAGAAALFAVTRVWASTTLHTPGLPTDRVIVSGVDAAPMLAGLAVVVVAGALAVVASGGWLRQLVGLLIAGVAGVAALRALTLDAGGPALSRALKESPAFLEATQPTVHGAVWPWIASVAFVVAGLLGLVVVTRGRSWSRMSARYERRAPSAADPVGERDLWRALDEGHDPTVGDDPR